VVWTAGFLCNMGGLSCLAYQVLIGSSLGTGCFSNGGQCHHHADGGDYRTELKPGKGGRSYWAEERWNGRAGPLPTKYLGSRVGCGEDTLVTESQYMFCFCLSASLLQPPPPSLILVSVTCATIVLRLCSIHDSSPPILVVILVVGSLEWIFVSVAYTSIIFRSIRVRCHSLIIRQFWSVKSLGVVFFLPWIHS
jgi:hypothetical protein